MNQREKLKEILIDFCNKRESRTFTLKELNAFYDDYRIIEIGGKTPLATIRRLLQELRDTEFITFLDKSGSYTLRGIDVLEKERVDLTCVDLTKYLPEKKEYLLEIYVRHVKWVKQAKIIHGDKCLYKNCNNTFIKENGERYIEVHHIIPLYKGGEDGLWNLSVLCAHHHRMAHFANIKDKLKIEKYLLKEVECRL